ncbi:MAG TPA: corrinoid protein [Bacteroidota bacterium]|jgi:5-methyltetrahydrofolate--homocysteine methyltransferase|nr:corrinoid protein [Bacteroidota bacterium]
MVNLQEIADNLIKGQAKKVVELTTNALNEGIKPEAILNEGLIAGMNVVGQKFKACEFYVPEVLVAARAMKGAMEVLKPKLLESGVQPIAKIAIGTVKGDLHDIGKNLVSMMLQGAGFEIIDLGVDVTPEKFIETVKNQEVKLVGMSALLTTTMPSMKSTIEAMKEAGVRDKVKVIIGGAPVSQAYADEIGADGYSPDAASAVEKAKELLNIA